MMLALTCIGVCVQAMLERKEEEGKAAREKAAAAKALAEVTAQLEGTGSGTADDGHGKRSSGRGRT
jgi:hypothetical protein